MEESPTMNKLPGIRSNNHHQPPKVWNFSICTFLNLTLHCRWIKKALNFIIQSLSSRTERIDCIILFARNKVVYNHPKQKRQLLWLCVIVIVLNALLPSWLHTSIPFLMNATALPWLIQLISLILLLGLLCQIAALLMSLCVSHLFRDLPLVNPDGLYVMTPTESLLTFHISDLLMTRLIGGSMDGWTSFLNGRTRDRRHPITTVSSVSLSLFIAN